MHREARCQCQPVLRDPSVTAAHCDTVLGEKRGTVSERQEVHCGTVGEN